MKQGDNVESVTIKSKDPVNNDDEVQNEDKTKKNKKDRKKKNRKPREKKNDTSEGEGKTTLEKKERKRTRARRKSRPLITKEKAQDNLMRQITKRLEKSGNISFFHQFNKNFDHLNFKALGLQPIYEKYEDLKSILPANITIEAATDKNNVCIKKIEDGQLKIAEGLTPEEEEVANITNAYCYKSLRFPSLLFLDTYINFFKAELSSKIPNFEVNERTIKEFLKKCNPDLAIYEIPEIILRDTEYTPKVTKVEDVQVKV